MGRWTRAAVLAALLLAGLAGCGTTPQTVELERPASSNRFHPVRQPGQPAGPGRVTGRRGT